MTRSLHGQRVSLGCAVRGGSHSQMEHRARNARSGHQNEPGASGDEVVTDYVLAHLRMNVAAARSLQAAINEA